MTTDTTVRYMERTRDYYAAHGYDKPYEWAHFNDIPFAPLNKTLATSTVTIVTTSMPAAMTARNSTPPTERVAIAMGFSCFLNHATTPARYLSKPPSQPSPCWRKSSGSTPQTLALSPVLTHCARSEHAGFSRRGLQQ